MTHRTSFMSLAALLALGLTATASMPAHAQYRSSDRVVVSRGAPAPPAIAFRRSPGWVAVPGTRVYVVRESERPGYDIFRYGSAYYLYDNGWWYRSNRWNGRFVAIDERQVPTAFYQVPRTEWRSYPSGWDNRANGWQRGRDMHHDSGRHRGESRRHGERRY